MNNFNKRRKNTLRDEMIVLVLFYSFVGIASITSIAIIIAAIAQLFLR